MDTTAEEIQGKVHWTQMRMLLNTAQFLRGREDLGKADVVLRQAGTWPSAAVLQCLHLDTPLLEQLNINTKKLDETKNCVHVQLEQMLDPKRPKKQKPNCHFWEAWSKRLLTLYGPVNHGERKWEGLGMEKYWVWSHSGEKCLKALQKGGLGRSIWERPWQRAPYK